MGVFIEGDDDVTRVALRHPGDQLGNREPKPQPVGLRADGAAVCLPGCCTFVLYALYKRSKNSRDGGI
jgi:hypothetical protein